jgi:hypothetical protein
MLQALSFKNLFDFYDFAVKTSSIPLVSNGFESKCFCPAITSQPRPRLSRRAGGRMNE